MTHAVVLTAHGGPDRLAWQAVATGEPGPGEARLRQTAVGLNYIDVYARTGLYPLLTPPAVIGMEAAGVVTALGARVDGLAVGDRVAYVAGPGGAYAETRLIAAKHLVRIPDGVSDEQAAAVMLKGLTAEYLLFRTHPVAAGDTILVHAAAGGVGLLLCQWGAAVGCTVIGTAGGSDKCALARRHGAHHVIDYRAQDVAAEVLRLTDGAGATVAYDGVGKDTFEASLKSLAMFGHLVSFGQSSGPVPAFTTAILGAKSLSVTRPSLFHYIADRARLEQMAARLFAALADGTLRVDIGQRFALRDAAAAHRALEARATTGATVLLP